MSAKLITYARKTGLDIQTMLDSISAGAQAVADEQTPLSGFSLHTNYLLWVVVGIVITGVFILILFIREKKLQKKAAKTKESEK